MPKMNKQEFLDALRMKLSGLPKQDIRERIVFYSEMIDDRIEEGLSEEEAVLDIGSVDEIVTQIIANIPISRIVKEKIKPKRALRTRKIVLLALGSPIWLSLAVAAVAVIFSLYIVLWSVIASVWAVFASLIACGLGGIIAGIIFAIGGNALTGGTIIGTSIVCAGLAIFLFFGCKAATKGTLRLTGKIAIGIKKCFIGEENA